jgi:hypothetical protein
MSKNITAIDEVFSNAPKVKISGDVLTVENAAGKNISIYAVDGKLIKNWISPSSSSYVTLPVGYYIIKVDKVTMKAIVR